jgi:hypothetical protein
LPTEKAAVKAREQGKNVVVEAERKSAPMSSAARTVEEKAGGKENTVRHDAHENSDRKNSGDTRPHYQPEVRDKGAAGMGHTLYGALALGTAEGTLSSDSGDIDKGLSAVVDFFNPIADMRDAIGLILGEDDRN